MLLLTNSTLFPTSSLLWLHCGGWTCKIYLLPASLAWDCFGSWAIDIQKDSLSFLIQLVSLFFLLSSYIECKHDAWSCNSHPVIIRKRPRELRRYQSKPWCCRTTEPKSTAAHPEPCENKEISPEGNKHLLFKSFFTQLFCYILT